MENNAAKLGFGNGAQNLQDYAHAKAYGIDSPFKSYSATKALGADPALATWLEEAKAWLHGVHSGEIKAEGFQVQEVQQWVQWTLAQNPALSAQWDPNLANFGDAGSEGVQGPQTSEFGGELGPDGSFNYDSVQSHTGFTGDGTRNNIYGTDNTQNFEQPSAKVTFEITMDHGVTVLKEIVTTSKGTAVYYFDDYNSPEFKLALNIADPTKVSGLDALPAELQAKITTAKYDPAAKVADETPESSLPGTKNSYGEWEYEGTMGEVIDFSPQPGEKGETQVHHVWGDSNISVMASDHVFVQHLGDLMMVSVKHKNGSQDTFLIEKGFNVNINANAAFVKFGGEKEGDPMSEDFADRVTLNGVEAESNPDLETADVQTAIEGFMSEAGIENEKLFLSALADAGYGEYNSIDEVVKSGDFPPAKPDQKLINLLLILDDDLNSARGKMKSATDEKSKQTAEEDFNNRLANLLGQLFPNTKVRADDFHKDVPSSAFFTVGKDSYSVAILPDGSATLEAKSYTPPVGGTPTVNDEKTNTILATFKSAAGGKTDAQVLSALNAAGFHFPDIEALKAAMNAQPPSFPPAFSAAAGSDFDKLIHALYALDSGFSGPLNSLKGTWENTSALSGYLAGTQKLVGLLQALYPDHNISMTYPNGNWQQRGFITFDTTNFRYSEYAGEASTFSGLKITPE